MGHAVGFLTLQRGDAILGGCVRIALAATTAGLATLGAGWVALGASDPAPAKPARGHDPARRARRRGDEADLPPLPTDSRAKVVEPVAGTVDGRARREPIAADPGPDRPPTRSRRAPPPPPSRGKNPARGGSTRRQGGRPGQRRRAAAAGGARGGQEDHRGRQRHRAHALLWGGGHGKWQDTGYDCSGSVSFALAAAGLLSAPLASGPLMSWGEPGKGKWVTIYTNHGHVFLEVAGIRFDTSAQRVTGSRWINEMRSTEGFVARHPPGL